MGVVGDTDRSYNGPGIGTGPWTCPSCSVLQGGDPNDGCASCGAGTAKAYKAPPAAQTEPAVRRQLVDVVKIPVELFAAWFDQYRAGDANPTALDKIETPLHDAFYAGYLAAQQQLLHAPPVTADVASLAPAGKGARTIVAALRLFRDQVLRDAKDEIDSGEWCSLLEVDQLIQQIERQEPQ